MSLRKYLLIKNIFFCWWIVFLFLQKTDAQDFSRVALDIVVHNKNLAYPTAGGLNCPQLSAVDLNNDGIQDLHIFDRLGNVHLPFLSDGRQYHFAPAYASYFPAVENWLLLRDYNGDGIMDLFAYSDLPGFAGIIVYTGFYENDHLAFKRFNFQHSGWAYNIIPFRLSSGTATQVYVSNIDYPAIDDVDCDGDLDILTFNVAGGYVEFYANQSKERGFGRDSLIFQLKDFCWGGFFESGITKAVDLSPVSGQCYRNLNPDGVSLRHAGSTLLTLDYDNDGDKDLILGDLSFDNLNFLTNGGTCTRPWATAQDNDFPSNSLPTDISTFPAAFWIDLDFDGKKDLAASPNATQISEDVTVIWWYQNTGTNALPKFEFRQKDFIANEMVDLGTNANPTFVDVDADGLQDLVVGNYSFFRDTGVKDARLFLFKNIGTPERPKYELSDDNYLNMNIFSQNTYHFTPAFGDLDHDGDLDILVGEEQGRLFYAENTAGAGNPMVFGNWQYGYQDIDVGLSSTPHIVDLNRDGLPDLVIGERNGNLNYFQNIGSQGHPRFNPNQDIAPNSGFLGKVDARVPGYVSGYSAPFFIEIDGKYNLLLGTEVGQIERYKNIEGNFYSEFEIETTLLGDIREGFQTRPALADIDNDGLLEMTVGNQRGGFAFFNTPFPADHSVAVEEISATPSFQCIPNPTSNELIIKSDATNSFVKKMRLLSVTGQILLQKEWSNAQISVDVSAIQSGIYFLIIEVNGKIQTEKIAVLH